MTFWVIILKDNQTLEKIYKSMLNNNILSFE